jgi:hypothetical protein
MIEQASQLLIDFPMHCHYCPSRIPLRPIAQCMVEQLMGNFIQGWLVQYHQICRARRQRPYRHVAKKPRHPTGDRL